LKKERKMSISNQHHEIFSVAQREMLLTAYVEKTEKHGQEYLVCEQGFLWNAYGIGDTNFVATCKKLGIEIPN